MTRITAAQARELAVPTVQERVDQVYPLIEKAAMKKQRSVHLHEDFWAQGGYNETKEWKEAVKLLEQDGYQVRFFWGEGQFVTLYTIVEW